MRRLIKQLFGHSLSTPLPLGVLIQKKDTYKVEMVQRRAIRWICNSYSNYDSVTAMQSDLYLGSLEQRRVDASVIMLYTIIHGIVAISLPVYFEQLSRQTRHSHPLAFRQIHTTANYYNYSFSPCLLFTGIDCQLRLSCCLHLISLVWQFGLWTTACHNLQQHSCF